MMPDEELIGRIESVMSSNPSAERIAEEVTDYIEEFIEEIEDISADQRCQITSLPTMLEDGTMIEIAITIHRFVSPDGEASFGLKVAGTSDQAQIVGLLELAKMQIMLDDDED